MNSSARSSRRAATEEALLDAFETVLAENGVRRLSANSVVECAGVGKPLLYRYFGNLAGLVRAWGVRRGFRRSGGRAPEGPGAQEADEEYFRRTIADELVAVANALASDPVMLELLAEEVTADSDLSAAFRDARGEHGRIFKKAMLNDPRYVRPENRRLIVILCAAVTYLAMRSRCSPRFMGLRLDTRAGWNEAMGMIRGIVLEQGVRAHD